MRRRREEGRKNGKRKQNKSMIDYFTVIHLKSFWFSKKKKKTLMILGIQHKKNPYRISHKT